MYKPLNKHRLKQSIEIKYSRSHIDICIPNNVCLGFSFIWFLLINPDINIPLFRFKISKLREL